VGLPAHCSNDTPLIWGIPDKTLSLGQAFPGGTTTLIWNGRSDRGTLAPAGNHLVRLVARGGTGTQATRACGISPRR
jgi:hypothetical protein